MNDLFTRLFRRTKANEDKVAEVGVRTTVLESRPKITGMDIYIQDTVPDVEGDFIWINTDVNQFTK